MRNGCSADSQRDDGFVLVFVVGLLLLFAGVTSALLYAAALETKARRTLSAHQELTAIADGVTRLLAYRLGEQRDGVRLSVPLAVDGRPYTCQFAQADIQFSLQDHAGLIDVNTASLGRLTRLLTAIEAPQPEQLAAAVIDFRDADDTPLAQGAELEAYRRAGMRHGPKNAPYDAIDELDQVIGFTPQIVARLRPLLTTRAPSAEIDASVAPQFLKTILELDTPNARPIGLRSDVPDGTSVRPGERGRSRIFTVQVTARLVEIVSIRHAVVEFLPRTPNGFVFQTWTSTADPRPNVGFGTPVACE